MGPRAGDASDGPVHGAHGLTALGGLDDHAVALAATQAEQSRRTENRGVLPRWEDREVLVEGARRLQRPPGLDGAADDPDQMGERGIAERTSVLQLTGEKAVAVMTRRVN